MASRASVANVIEVIEVSSDMTAMTRLFNQELGTLRMGAQRGGTVFG